MEVENHHKEATEKLTAFEADARRTKTIAQEIRRREEEATSFTS